MIDVVFPDGNEKDFLETAELLGLKGLVFVYNTGKDFFKGKSKLEVFNALLADPRKPVREKADFTLYKAGEHTRPAIERGFNVVFELEEVAKKDPMHYRASGLNQVLCRLAAKKKVKVGFSFASVLRASGQSRAQILGRMAQNIVFCRKFKVPTLIASFARTPFELRNPSDLASFFTVLGMHPEEAKKALGLR